MTYFHARLLFNAAHGPSDGNNRMPALNGMAILCFDNDTTAPAEA